MADNRILIRDSTNFIGLSDAFIRISLKTEKENHRGHPALDIACRYGRAHASPNAGYPEAAFAGALGLWMGGPNHYHGRLMVKPVIGDGLAEARPPHIRRAYRLMMVTSLLVFMVAAIMVLLQKLVV